MSLDEQYHDEFLKSYIACAFWADLRDDEGNNIDDEYDVDDLTDAARQSMKGDCDAFIAANEDDLLLLITVYGQEPSQAGHDFWLTRNGHGAGFWDRGTGEVGQRLADVSRPYGEQSLWIDLNGKVNVE